MDSSTITFIVSDSLLTEGSNFTEQVSETTTSSIQETTIYTTEGKVLSTSSFETTPAPNDSVPLAVIIGGAVGGLVVTIITLVVVILLIRKYSCKCCPKKKPSAPPLPPSISAVDLGQQTSQIDLLGNQSAEEEYKYTDVKKDPSDRTAGFFISDETYENTEQDNNFRLHTNNEADDIQEPKYQRSSLPNYDAVGIHGHLNTPGIETTHTPDIYDLSPPNGDTYDIHSWDKEYMTLKKGDANTTHANVENNCKSEQPNTVDHLKAPSLTKTPTYANLPKSLVPPKDDRKVDMYMQMDKLQKQDPEGASQCIVGGVRKPTTTQLHDTNGKAEDSPYMNHRIIMEAKRNS